MSEVPSPPSGGAAISRALPQFTLDRDGRSTLARPAPGSTLDFPPFKLSAVPRSLADWCSHAAQRFWAERGRCLGIVLLFDVQTREWSVAIPAQRCGKTASCWSAARADFPAFPPHAVLGGSFQTRVLAGGEEPSDCPPPHDGIHLVQRAGPEPSPQPVWCLARRGGRTFTVEPEDVLFDDVELALHQATPRLTLL
jgi:hypothetical protein